mgnify:CR=1 FL=1
MDTERGPGGMEEPPPFMRNWKRVYAAIVLYTVALVLTLYVMTVTLNR